MKRIAFTLALAFFAVAAFAQTWTLEPTHTQVTFSVDHMGISEVSGRFNKFDGSITAAKDDFSDGKGEITIQTASINTENEGRDAHLQKDDFFDAARFPTLKFVITSMKKTGANYEVKGNLTIKGVTKPVTLTGAFKGAIKDPWGNDRAGFLRLQTTINRQDFGVSGGGIMIGDEVRINISAELVKKK